MFETYCRQPQKTIRKFEFMFIEVLNWWTSVKRPLWTERPCSKMILGKWRTITLVFLTAYFSSDRNNGGSGIKDCQGHMPLRKAKVRDPENKHSYLRRTKIKGMIYHVRPLILFWNSQLQLALPLLDMLGLSPVICPHPTDRFQQWKWKSNRCKM